MNLSTLNDNYKIYYNQIISLIEKPLYNLEFYSKPKAMGEFEDEQIENNRNKETSFLSYDDFKKISGISYDKDKLVNISINMLLKEYDNEWFSEILYG